MYGAELRTLQVPAKDARQTSVFEAPPALVVAFHDAVILRRCRAYTESIHNGSKLVAVAQARQREVALRLHRVRHLTIRLGGCLAARGDQKHVRRSHDA